MYIVYIVLLLTILILSLTYTKKSNSPITYKRTNETKFCWKQLRVTTGGYVSTVRTNTAKKKIKFYIKDFFSKYDQIQSFLRIWPNILKKSLMENLIFRAV